MKVYQCNKCGNTTETTAKNWLSITSDGFGEIINGFTERKLVEYRNEAFDFHFCCPKCFFSYFQHEKTFLIKNQEYKIVCICGSSKFKDEIIRVRKKFTENGFIVLSPEVFMHAGDEVSEQHKEKLDALHFAKIEMADFVYIVDADGISDSYVGESTTRETYFAQNLNKQVFLHSHFTSIEEVLNRI
jgi:hypothetical protein